MKAFLGEMAVVDEHFIGVVNGLEIKVKAMPTCELCHREMGDITPHYLMPRTRHKKKKSKHAVTRDGGKGRPVALCRPCHKRVHMLLNKEVEQYF
jgi:hypothetical protein